MTTVPTYDVRRVVDALRARSGQFEQVAAKGSLKVMREKEEGDKVRDIRSSAVTLVDAMATAQVLTDIADQLESGSLLIVTAPSGDDPEPAGQPDTPVVVEPHTEPGDEPGDEGGGDGGQEDIASLIGGQGNDVS